MNKKIIALALSVLALAGIFSACNKDGDDTQTTVPNTSDTAASTTASASAATAVTDNPTIAITDTTAAQTTTQKATTATTTTKKADESTYSVSGIASAVVNGASFTEEMASVSANRAATVFGLSSSDYSDIAYYTASTAVAEELLVIKASDESALSTIKGCINSRISKQKENYSSYRPDEVPKLEDAVIYTEGLYVVYCVSASNAEGVIASQF